jgi:sucrose phosphorylase
MAVFARASHAASWKVPDRVLGDWADIKRLTGHLDVMADVIVNHMSSESPQCLD